MWQQKVEDYLIIKNNMIIENVYLTKVGTNEFKGKTSGVYSFLKDGEPFRLFGEYKQELADLSDLKKGGFVFGRLDVGVRVFSGLLKIRFENFVSEERKK